MQKGSLPWESVKRFVIAAIGSAVAATGYSLFHVPFQLSAGGVGGFAIIANHYTGLPVGMLILISNVPLLIVGFRMLGGWSFLVKTLSCILVFSLVTDGMALYYASGEPGLTSDTLLATIYGGLLLGLGVGIVYRAGATTGGTSILTRIVHQRSGMPMSQLHLIIDGTVITGAGFAFGWEIALYSLLGLILIGMVVEYVLEGPSVVRTATIITDYPDLVCDAITERVDRGSSTWPIRGGYTGEEHAVVFCTVHRAQLATLRSVVVDADPAAFVVITNSRQALGSGFQPLSSGAGF